MKTKDLSIIIPVYNKAKYINKCLNSLLLNSACNYEIIIVNDGSTDFSLEICNSFKKRHKECNISIYSQSNKGVSSARNYGINVANGNYIMFMDADDYVKTNLLEDSIKIINEYQPDILFSNVKKVDCNDTVIVENKFPYKGLLHMDDLYSEFYHTQSTTGLYGCVSNKIIKKDLLTRNFIVFNPNIKLAEDFDFYLELYKFIGTCYFFNDSYLYYLQNADNSSTSDQKYHTPDYFVQGNILYKEYRLLKQKGITQLDDLCYRINDYILFYLKENCDRKNFSFKLNGMYDSPLFFLISLKNRNFFDKLLLYSLKNKNDYMVKFLIIVYHSLRNIKNI